MGQVCDVCGKRPSFGNQVTTRGRAKYLGGVGVKTTGVSRRQFKPNLRRVRISTPEGTHRTIRACTQCLRSGLVTKIVRHRPFRLPAEKATPGVAKAQTATGAKAMPEVALVPYSPPEGVKVRKRKRVRAKPEEPAEQGQE